MLVYFFTYLLAYLPYYSVLSSAIKQHSKSMKTNTIILGLYSPSYNAPAMERLCNRYQGDVETRQTATYTVADGLATITALEPTIATRVNLPLPFVLPVNDLGSGILNRIDINIDTLTAQLAICPKQSWVDRRAMQANVAPAAPTITQTLMADYIGLL